MRDSYGYETYRGRSRLQTALTVLAAVLAVVLVLAVAFFFFAQQYIVYDDQGKAHLELPFFSREGQPSSAPSPTSEDDVVVVTPTPSPTTTAAPVPVVVELPLSALLDGTAEEQTAAAGGNAALFVLKDEEGFLGYVSGEEMAIGAQVNSPEPRVNGAIRAANGGTLYTIAKISAFKDLTVPYVYSEGNSLRSQSGNWRAPDGCRWFSPASQAVRDYLCGVCVELCELGFDEILLDHCAYPDEGHVEWLVHGELYDETTLTEELEGFCAQLREALADYPDVTVSMTARPDVFAGSGDGPSGQTPALLGRYAQRVYLPAPDGADWTAALEEMGLKDGELIYPQGEVPAGCGTLIPLSE